MHTPCFKVIMKIVEALAPIVPLTLGERALGGEHLRTALKFLEAAEFMLAQYETDVRRQANPNGVVGLSADMHDEFERTVVLNDQLKPLEVVMNCMEWQYQISLGPSSLQISEEDLGSEIKAPFSDPWFG